MTHLFWSPSIVFSPDICRKVLTDEENFKPKYPASIMALAGKSSFHTLPCSEHKRLRRLITSPINGHEALSTYTGLMEDITVKHLEELSTMNKLCEFLKEIKKSTFEIITKIFLSSDFDQVDLALFENLYNDFFPGMQSPAINLPGFAFHKALKVIN